MKSRLDTFWAFAETVELSDFQQEQVDTLERAILRAPAFTVADLTAKVEVLRANLLAGPRCDGADLAALDTITAWARRHERLAA